LLKAKIFWLVGPQIVGVLIGFIIGLALLDKIEDKKPQTQAVRVEQSGIAKVGTKDNPFDWSSATRQLGTAKDLPADSSMEIYVKTASGAVRLATPEEIQWTRRQAGLE